MMRTATNTPAATPKQVIVIRAAFVSTSAGAPCRGRWTEPAMNQATSPAIKGAVAARQRLSGEATVSITTHDILSRRIEQATPDRAIAESKR